MKEKFFDELRFYVEARPAGDLRVYYRVYDVAYTDDDGSHVFYKAGSDRRLDHARKVRDAACFAKGSVKWDGCSNWKFDQDNIIHGCSKEDLARIGLVLGECWDWTAELIPDKWTP